MDLTRRAFGLGALGLLLSACGEAVSAAPGRRGNRRDAPVRSLTALELADAQRAFGLDLLGRIAKPGDNTSVSPVSLALCLGLLDAAAGGETERALSELLHLPRWGDDVVAAYAAQHRELHAIRDQLRLSNRVYTAVGGTVRPRTLDDWATGFDASLAQLDFARQAKQATLRINADVKADTRGKIPRLFDEPVPRDSSAVLVNALYVKADWTDPFDKHGTLDREFTTDTGRRVMVRMMSGAFGDFRDSDGWHSVTLGYEGDRLQMVAVLPPKGVEVASVTVDQLTALATKESTSTAAVTMPALDLTQTHELLDVLAVMGLPVVHADYSAINADSVSKVVQKTVLKVDEKGTEAAAATGTSVFPASAIGGGLQVVLDRPYLLLLQDTKTRSPLFLTRVVDPTA